MTEQQSTTLTEKQGYWLSHLQSAHGQQLSLVDYAQANHLEVKSLYQWKWLLNKKGLLSDTLVENHTMDMTFAQVQVQRHTTTLLSVCFPNGVRLEMEGVNAPALQQLIQCVGQL